MDHSEIRVVIARPLAEVFATYTLPEPWGWTTLSNIHWTEGQPWELGSRLHVEPDAAYGVVCDQVLTQFKPNSQVGFISHFGGLTMQSEVSFRALSDGSTEVHCRLAFIGTFSRIAGFPFKSAIESGAKQFYEEFKRVCERTGASQSSPRAAKTAEGKAASGKGDA